MTFEELFINPVYNIRTSSPSWSRTIVVILISCVSSLSILIWIFGIGSMTGGLFFLSTVKDADFFTWDSPSETVTVTRWLPASSIVVCQTPLESNGSEKRVERESSSRSDASTEMTTFSPAVTRGMDTSLIDGFLFLFSTCIVTVFLAVRYPSVAAITTSWEPASSYVGTYVDLSMKPE